MNILKMQAKCTKIASKDKGELKEEIVDTKGYEPNHIILTQFKDIFDKHVEKQEFKDMERQKVENRNTWNDKKKFLKFDIACRSYRM